MGRVSVPAYTEVARRPRFALAATCLVGAVVVVAVAVAGLLMSAPVSLFALLPALLLAHVARREGAGTEPRVVEVGVDVSPAGVAVEMPGARLLAGRYVDQRYWCAAGDVESAGLDQTGTFRLRARTLTSEAVEGGAVLDRRAHEFGEVSFHPVSGEDAARLAALFSA